MKFDAVYYEPHSLDYPLGQQLREKFGDLPWIPIESHNSIPEMQEKPNSEFGRISLRAADCACDTDRRLEGALFGTFKNSEGESFG